jgi:hypothetical protein
MCYVTWTCVSYKHHQPCVLSLVVLEAIDHMFTLQVPHNVTLHPAFPVMYIMMPSLCRMFPLVMQVSCMIQGTPLATLSP